MTDPHIRITYADEAEERFPRHVYADRKDSLLDAVGKYCQWNRHDLVWQLWGVIPEEYRWNFPTAQDLERKGLTKRGLGIGSDTPPGYREEAVMKGGLSPTDPGNLVPHRRSVVAFLRADPGHAFTGLVRIGTKCLEGTPSVAPPKIFLFPTTSGSVTRIGTAGGDKGYAVKANPTPTTGVYQLQVQGPIEHLKKQFDVLFDDPLNSGGSQASHLQLANMIRGHSGSKYYHLQQKEGDFVGFTVSKGDWRNSLPNRYSMTSLGSNAHAFGERGLDDFRKYPTVQWRDAIIRACDRLSELEASHTEEQDLGRLCDSILEGRARENEVWRRLKQEYWPRSQAGAASSPTSTLQLPSFVQRMVADRALREPSEDDWDDS